MNRHVAMLVMAGLALTGTTSGCALRSTSDMPSAAVRSEPAIPRGAWGGTLGGRETADAQGEELGTAHLTIAPDATFTLEQTFGNMQGLATMRATGTARMTRGQIVLDGQVATPESRKGEPFITMLRPHGDALYGSTDVLYRGVKIGTLIELGRVR
jgi:hypothetical protein